MRKALAPEDTTPGSYGAISTWAEKNMLMDLLGQGADEDTPGVEFKGNSFNPFIGLSKVFVGHLL